MNFLIVDDSPLDRKIVKRRLFSEFMSCNINEAENGEIALNFVKKNLGKKTCPDLITLDLNMPVMTGLDFLWEFKKLEHEARKGIKIVVITSSGQVGDMLSLKKFSSVSKVYQKPFLKENCEDLKDFLNCSRK